MLKPSVQVGVENGVFVAEFWDCLRLDPVPVQDLRARFDEHLRRGGRGDLIVDLLGVGFAGSAALGGFVALQRVARGKGGRMVFANVDPTVQEVFRVSKLEGLFSFAPDRAAALTELAAPDSSSDIPTASPPPAAKPNADSRPTGHSRLRRRLRPE
ncbi:MAG TPA: STAS domain-containing protein [Isosphaeraceae bacterium]